MRIKNVLTAGLVASVLSSCGEAQAQQIPTSINNYYDCPDELSLFVRRVESNGVFCRNLTFAHGAEDNVSLIRFTDQGDIKTHVLMLVHSPSFRLGNGNVWVWVNEYENSEIVRSISFWTLNRQFAEWSGNRVRDYEFLERMSDEISIAFDLLEQNPTPRPTF